jgi:UDP-N-acetylmuramoyl-tripeptide--D-alanyl-D-alanine ligase
MIPMTLEEIAKASDGRRVAPPGGESQGVPAVRSVTTDTRSAKAGDLFFALRGPNFDAHDFLPQAAKAGCAAAVVRRGRSSAEAAAMFPGGLIAVADTTAALNALASYHRRKARAKAVAVTGSNGKTTVNLMIHHVLSRGLKGFYSPKSFNNNIGVPLTLLGVAEGDDYVVCEVGTNAPGEIAALGTVARPDVAVITSVAETHLEKLGNLEGVAAEKASILGCLAEGGAAVVCADSDELERALRRYDRPMVRFGESPRADFRLTGYESDGRRQRFEINGSLRAELPLPGRHNALNALAALAVARQFGIAPAEAAGALRDFSGPEMRLQWVHAGTVTIINDAYNANPASVLAAAEALADVPASRRVMIVGDMRELGSQQRRLHLRTGSDIASRGVDLLIGVGRLGRYIAMGAAETGTRTAAFETLTDAFQGAPALLAPGDVVLVKGSRAMGMEHLIEPIRAAFAQGAASATDRG